MQLPRFPILVRADPWGCNEQFILPAGPCAPPPNIPLVSFYINSTKVETLGECKAKFNQIFSLYQPWVPCSCTVWFMSRCMKKRSSVGKIKLQILSQAIPLLGISMNKTYCTLFNMKKHEFIIKWWIFASFFFVIIAPNKLSWSFKDKGKKKQLTYKDHHKENTKQCYPHTSTFVESRKVLCYLNSSIMISTINLAYLINIGDMVTSSAKATNGIAPTHNPTTAL